MTDEDPEIFFATFEINQKKVSSGSFEWRTGTLRHKIAEAIKDEQAKKVRLFDIKHSSSVMSESLSIISQLNKPDTGFESI